MLFKIYLCYGCSTPFMLGFNIHTPITIPAWFINCNYIMELIFKCDQIFILCNVITQVLMHLWLMLSAYQWRPRYCRRFSSRYQWRSQSYSFGGGGQFANAEGTRHSRGPGGMFPRKILKSRVSQMQFPGDILQKKILLLRITHSHRPPPPFNFSLDFIFSQGWSFSSLGGLRPPLPPPCLRH